MTAERLELVRRSLDELLSLPAVQRVQRLNRLCRDDPSLRAELESLLRFHGVDPADAPGSGARDTATLTFGELIAGRYRVGGWLGRGAAGDVYLVHDRTTSTSLALKATHSASGLSVPRLEREARLVSRIQHEAVCQVYDLFEYGGRACLLMEFVDGKDLSTLLAQAGRLPPARVREIGRALGEGLGAAHDLGIVHRDLKPANVLIDRAGRVKIADFGIAAAADETTDGRVGGTPAYMAPEQLRGDGPITPRCDVYALAAVLFEAATGRPPFAGSDPVELTDRKLAGPAPPPSRLCPELDADLEAAIVAGLASEPGDRPESGRAFAALLEPRVEERGPGLSRPEQRVVSVLAVGLRQSSEARASRAAEIIDLVTQVVAEHEGHVASVSHGSVLAYFGFPTAMEAHSDRALRAARDLATRGVEAARAAGIDLRMGVETGEVLLARVTDGSSGLAFGDPPAAAERLREAAGAGEALVSPASLRWAREPFATSGEVRADVGGGGDGDGLAYRLEPKAIPSASPLPRLRAASFVGRAGPLAQLDALWARARAGHSQAVLVTGEAGIGKSRLIQAFRDRLSAPTPRWLELGGTPERRSTAFWPLRGLLEEAIAPASADATTRTARLRALAQLLLGPPTGAAAVLVCEDLQWCDPSTLDVIDALVAEAGSSPLLVIGAARPGVAVPWRVDSLIQLPRLAPDEAALLVDALVEDRPLDDAARARVLERGEGVPLYLEALVERAARSGTPDARTTGVPESLRGLLEAQLDRLGRAKQTAQLGACLGHRFAASHLAAIRGLEAEDLAEDLDRIVRAGVLRRVEGRSGDSYEFTHALLADAAYGTLPDPQQREAHAAIAVTLAQLEPALTERHPELLARHIERAGVPDAALEAWERAGIAAASRSEYVEARSHLERALALLPEGGAPDPRDAVELRLRTALTGPLVFLDNSSFELERNLETIRTLIGDEGDSRLVPVLVQLARLYMQRGDGGKRAELAEQQERALLDAPREVAIAIHSQLASGYTDGGNLPSARRHHEALLRIAPENGAIPSDPLSLWGFIVGVPVSAWALYYGGRLREASARLHRWISRLEELPLFMRAASESLSAAVLLLLGEFGASHSMARDGLATSLEHHFQMLTGRTRAIVGASLAAAGDPEGGVVELRRAVAEMKARGTAATRPFAESFLAEALLALGRLDEAEAVIASAMDAVRVGTDQVWEPDLHRIRGRLLARSGRLEEAEQCLGLAVSLASERGIRSLELRAGTELARFLRQAGRPEAARTALAPLCAAFVGELETPDVRAARQVLAS
ncbi:MAG: protein kinase [Myxococcota bacterium]|nr:protein kinase [Myxococcota bacterium]